jgi:hypothetical protein
MQDNPQVVLQRFLDAQAARDALERGCASCRP